MDDESEISTHFPSNRLLVNFKGHPAPCRGAPPRPSSSSTSKWTNWSSQIGDFEKQSSLFGGER